jgi:CheY-like chemotaxis protein
MAFQQLRDAIVLPPKGESMSRILYVEDECLLQMDGEGALIEAGYEVVLASDGQTASARLRQDDARYDALITDIDLPGDIQGWQIAALSRQINGRLPVIYVTGQALCDFQEMGVSHSLMMPKPFAWASLITSLSGLIAAAVPIARTAPAHSPPAPRLGARG